MEPELSGIFLTKMDAKKSAWVHWDPFYAYEG